MEAATATASAPTYLQVLRVREFQVLFASQIISILGSVVAQLALSVLVFEDTGSPLLAALAFALGFVPYALGGVLLSAVADGLPPRPVLVGCDLVGAVVAVLMAVPGIPVAGLLGLALLLGLVGPIYGGTKAAVIADVLPGPAFPLGRSLLRIVAQTVQVGGFAIGGLVLALVTPREALLLDGALFACSALVLRVGTRSRPARAAHDGGARGLARASLAALRELLASPALRPIILLFWLPPAFMVAPEALATPYAYGLDGGRSQVGLLLSAGPVGAVIGELAAGRMSPARRDRILLPAAVWAFLPPLAFLARPSLGPALVLLALAGAGGAYFIGLDARLLAAAPERLRGRALTVTGAGMMFAQGLGFALAGAAAQLAHPSRVIVAAALAGLLTVLTLAASLRRAARLA